MSITSRRPGTVKLRFFLRPLLPICLYSDLLGVDQTAFYQIYKLKQNIAQTSQHERWINYATESGAVLRNYVTDNGDLAAVAGMYT